MYFMGQAIYKRVIRHWKLHFFYSLLLITLIEHKFFSSNAVQNAVQNIFWNAVIDLN